MQKTIYIPTKEMYDSMKAEAGKVGESVSGYLVWLHKLYQTKEFVVPADREVLDAPSKSVSRRLSVQKDAFFKPNPKKGKK